MAEATPEALVRAFYERLWNAWDTAAAGELLAEDIAFRGSLGVETRGHEAFLGYVAQVRAAFPDFHNHIETLVTGADRAAARLTYTGTHRGEVLGVAPTGRRITYAGAAFFRMAGGRIAEVWVLGDRLGLLEQLHAAMAE